MAYLNRVQFIGNVGQDPVFKDHGNDFVTASFSLATTKTWRDSKTQQRKERTDWHRIEVSGRLAEIVRDIVGQGDELYVEGELQTDRVERKGEPGVYDYFTKIRAEAVQKLNKRDRKGDAGDDGGNEGGSDVGGSGGDAPAAAAPAAAPTSAPAAQAQASAPAPAAGGPRTRTFGNRNKQS